MIVNFTENSVKMTKTDYDPERSLVLIEGLSHFLTNFLQNLASCQTSFINGIKWSASLVLVAYKINSEISRM
jgi:hypothetical protein